MGCLKFNSKEVSLNIFNQMIYLLLLFTRKFIERRLFASLSCVKSSRNYGAERKKTCEWSFCMGYTTNTFGLCGFNKDRHNVKKLNHLGYCGSEPLNRSSYRSWQKSIWSLCCDYIHLYNLPSFSSGGLIFLFFLLLIKLYCR